MSNIKKTNPVLENPTQIITSGTQQLTGLLGISVSESDILVICQATILLDKRALIVREIIRRLCLIFAGQEKLFLLTARILKNDFILFNTIYENSFFYDKALTQTCQYLVPNKITEGNGLELLKALMMWKQNPPFQRFPALAVVLILYLLQWLVMTDKRLRDHMHILLPALILTPPQQLIEYFHCLLQNLIFQTNSEEEKINDHIQR